MTSIIRVIDLETTGFAPPEHAVCEIGHADLESETTDLAGTPTGFRVMHAGSCLVAPGRPIPPEASAIHHIIDADVAGAHAFAFEGPLNVSDRLGRIGPGSEIIALAAHSAKFERQWLTDELTGGTPWICTYKCALRLWPDAPGHSNQTLRYFLNPPLLERRHAAVAHRAGPDAYVTAHLLALMLERASVAELIAWSAQPALQVTCHIGQYRRQKWRDVPWSFLDWVSTRDFDEDVLFTVRTELERREREAEAESADDNEIESTTA